MIFNFLSLLQLFSYIIGLSIFCYKKGMSLYESVFVGICTTLISLSLIFQFSFLLGIPSISYLFEIFALVLSMKIIVDSKRDFVKVLSKFSKSIISDYFMILLFTFIFILFFICLVKVPHEGDSLRYHLSRILLFQDNKSLFLEPLSQHQSHLTVFPIGNDILFHIFLRNHYDFGVNIFGLLYFISTIFGTYSVSRLFYNHKISIATTFVLISMTMVVLHSTLTKNDLATGVASILTLYTLLKLYKSLDISMLILNISSLAWGLSIKSSYVLFCISIAIVSVPYLVLSGKFNFVRKFLIGHYQILLVLIIPIFVLSNSWLYINNYLNYENFLGPIKFVEDHSNKDGIYGGLANLSRFLYSSLDYTKIPIYASKKFFDINIKTELDSIFHIISPFSFEGYGMSRDYTYINKTPSAQATGSWFGPAAYFLIYPALLISFFSSKRLYMRLYTLILFIYLFLLLYSIGWHQWNGRFFIIFFLLSGIPISSMIEYWSDSKLILLKVCSILLLLYSLLIMINNNNKYYLFHKGYSEASQKTINRDSTLKYSVEKIPLNSTVCIVTSDNTIIYHYLLYRPDLNFEFVTSEEDYFYYNKYYKSLFDKNPKNENRENFDYLINLSNKKDSSGDFSTLGVSMHPRIWKVN